VRRELVEKMVRLGLGVRREKRALAVLAEKRTGVAFSGSAAGKQQEKRGSKPGRETRGTVLKGSGKKSTQLGKVKGQFLATKGRA